MISGGSFSNASDVIQAEGICEYSPGGIDCPSSDSVGSSAISSPGRRGRAASVTYELRGHRSASAYREFVDTYAGASESEDACWPGEEKKTVRSIGVLTDCDMVSIILYVFITKVGGVKKQDAN